MPPTTTLVFGAVAILVVVAWFVFGVIDGTRAEPDHDSRSDPRSDPRTDAGTDPSHQRTGG
ncbi:hypothetical protein ACXR8F_02950 [Terrabacter sp. AAH1]